MDNIKDFVSSVLLNNNIEAKELFNNLVSERAMEKLSDRKREIAQSLFQTEENVNEEHESLDETPKVDQGLSGKQKKAARAERGTNQREPDLDRHPYNDPEGLEHRIAQNKKMPVVKSGVRAGKLPLDTIQRTKDAIKSRLNKEEVESLDEISTGKLARAAWLASDPESHIAYDKYHDPQKFADYAKKTKDPKSAANVQRAADGVGHFPRPNHVSGRGDPLRDREMRSTNPNMVTKAGKLTKGAQKGLKSSLTREEIESLDEKALSQAQQKFMGMVYAAKKGMKPASPEVARAAAGMTTKQAREYAATKHAGLPERKKELEEGPLTTAALGGLGGAVAGPVGAAIGAGLGHLASKKP